MFYFYQLLVLKQMSKIREKESLECGRMHIGALKTQKLPGPFSVPWTPAANCSLCSHDSASLHRHISASGPGPPLTKSWIRTWIPMWFSGKMVKQESIPVGCVPSAVVTVGERGLCFLGGLGVCFPGVYPSMHWGRHPPVDRMTDRSKKHYLAATNSNNNQAVC